MDYKMYYLALRNPSAQPADWPKLWRSHPKFVSQFPAIGGRIASINYNARLYGVAEYEPHVNKVYDGVAVVSSPDDTLRFSGTPSEVHDKVMEDERRVFGAYTHNSASFGKETLVLGGSPDGAVIVRFIRRKPGIATGEFNSALVRVAQAAQTAVDAGAVSRFVQVEVLGPCAAGHDYDAIQEAWFASPQAAEAALENKELAVLFDAAGAFSDPLRSVTLVAENIYRYPRA